MAIQALLVILAVLLALLFLGVPISYAIAVSSLTAILSSIDLNVAVLTAAQRTFVGMSKFSLTAIPFFILAGNIMNQGGIAKRLVDFVMAILGKMPGALLVLSLIHISSTLWWRPLPSWRPSVPNTKSSTCLTCSPA